MVRLFEISAQIEWLLTSSVDPETGEINEAALDELTALETTRNEKALAVAAFLLGQEAEADAIARQAKIMNERAFVHRRHAERLRAYIAANIDPGQKIENHHVAIGWRKSEAVRVLDETLIPDLLWRVKREPAKDEIKKALKAGEVVPGCELELRNNLVVR